MNNFDPAILTDPMRFQENRLPAHSDHTAYGTDYEFLIGKSGSRHSLNGLWKFHYAENATRQIDGFEDEALDCHNWEDIYVPAHIQMEGYGVPHYTNQTYPWEGTDDIVPGEVPEHFNPVASYVKYFTLPQRFHGRRVFISFQGVESGFALWLNGRYIGYSEDSFDPSEFDITDALKEGINKLAVRVWKWTKSSWFEDQDFFRFSGIFRDVYLYTVADSHIWDIRMEAEPDAEYKNGNLKLRMLSEGKGAARISVYKGGKLPIYPILPKEENLIAVREFELGTTEIPALPLTEDAKGRIPDPSCWRAAEISIPVPDVELWSAEKPYLYFVKIEVLDADGKVQELIYQHAGFRRFELINGIMCINGKRIVFKGANRHEFTSFGGRVPDHDSLIQDLLTMKRNNINAIRTCHYPNDSEIYGLCDILGLYMIAENNMETHGTWNVYESGARPLDWVLPKDHTEWRPLLLDRIVSCYQRDKNHAAILIWSVGNESFGGVVIRDMANLFRKLDDKRLVHYEGIFHDRSYQESSDMESQMYSTVAYIEQFMKDNPEKPFICCEYTHAMGNSCGGMNKYTDLSDREPRYQGGFIWDYIDQSIYKKDRYGKEFLAYGGDFGDRPSDTTFSGNGIVYGGERKVSPKMQEVKFNYQNISVEFGEDCFTVINKNLFINTGDYAVLAILRADGRETLRIPMSCPVEPLSLAEFEVPAVIREYMKQAELDAAAKEDTDIVPEFALSISFRLKKDTQWAKADHEVAFGQKVFKKPVKEYTCNKKMRVVRTPAVLGIHGEHFSVMFGTLSDGMISYKYAGREMLPNTIPKPNFWRAPISNDEGYCMQYRYSQWKIASLYAAAKTENLFAAPGPEIEILDTSVKVTYTLYMPTNPRSECQVTYVVFGDGTVQTTLSYQRVPELGDMPEFGMMFKLDADYDTVEWYGLGPDETYSDRMCGGRLGVFKRKVADNMAEYLRPQECGNKCGVRYAKVIDRKGRGLLFFGDELSFSALPYTPHEVENAAHTYELPPVHYTVVRVAKQQMGIGGDDSWGSMVPEEFHIAVEPKMEFTFCFRGI